MEVPRHWRLQETRLKLVGSNCPKCEIKHFPSRIICPDCGHNSNITPEETEGVIYSATDCLPLK